MLPVWLRSPCTVREWASFLITPLQWLKRERPSPKLRGSSGTARASSLGFCSSYYLIIWQFEAAVWRPIWEDGLNPKEYKALGQSTVWCQWTDSDSQLVAAANWAWQLSRLAKALRLLGMVTIIYLSTYSNVAFIIWYRCFIPITHSQVFFSMCPFIGAYTYLSIYV